MPDWQEGDVQANGLRLHYTRTGGPKPPLVLAHGFSDDGPCWTAVAEALEDEYDVVMVDARCHGRSEAPDRPFTALEQAADLAGAIEALALSRPIILGHSMGAATTLALAGTRPDVPRAILLEDPPARWMPAVGDPPADDGWRDRMRAWIEGLQSKSREQLIAEERATEPGWSDVEVTTWVDSKLRLSPKIFRRDAAPPDVDWRALASAVTCPALLIMADPDRGALVTPDQAAVLSELMPHVKVARIPNAGHSIHRDRFALYMDAVRTFLAGIPGP